MRHGKYKINTSYLLGNFDAGIQEFAGMGNRVNNKQTRWTDKSQMMTSRRGRTSQSHKQIAQTNRTNEVAQNMMTSRPGMEMTKRCLGCSRATQVRMEYLRLVNLTEICPSRRVGHFKAPC